METYLFYPSIHFGKRKEEGWLVLTNSEIYGRITVLPMLK
jgi:hypothetical protein